MFFILSEVLWVYLLNDNRLGLDIASFLLFLLFGWIVFGIIGIVLDIHVILTILAVVLILVIIISIATSLHCNNRKKEIAEKEKEYGE